MKLLVFVLAGSLASGVEAAHAQGRPDAPASEPNPLHYESALRDYRPFEDLKVRPWRESNQQVSPAPADARSVPGEARPTQVPESARPRQADAAKEQHHGH